MYIEALVPLLHGPGMDENPEIISTENMQHAELLLQEWKKVSTRSVIYDIERIWLNFLLKRYKEGIEVGKHLQTRANELEGGFYAMIFWRNLGFCYDMLGNRGEAIKSYTKGEEVAKEMGGSPEMVQAIFKDYKQKPFIRN